MLSNVEADRFALELNGPLSPGRVPAGRRRRVRARRDARPDDVLTDAATERLFDDQAAPIADAPILRGLAIRDLRGYAALDAVFEPGPQLVWGPNAAGKTSLLEAIVLLAWGRSHRTSTDGELVRWGQELARVEARVGRADTPPEARDTVEVALVRTAVRRRPQADPRQRRRAPGGGARRACCGRCCSRPRRCCSWPARRRSGARPSTGSPASDRPPTPATSRPTGARSSSATACCGSIREEQATRDELRVLGRRRCSRPAAAVREERQRLLEALAAPLAAAHARDRARRGGRRARCGSPTPPTPRSTPASRSRDALARRLAETAEKEVWNGTTLIGPHRDDLVFEMGGRPLASFASRGQQRTAILAFKLAELDLLTALDGRPPLLLLDDVFSELDPERRAHLVRRIAALPQAFVTTTTLDDLDPALRAVGTAWSVTAGADGIVAPRAGDA